MLFHVSYADDCCNGYLENGDNSYKDFDLEINSLEELEQLQIKLQEEADKSNELSALLDPDGKMQTKVDYCDGFLIDFVHKTIIIENGYLS